MQINVRADFADIRQRLHDLRDDIGRKAMAATLNRVAESTRTQATREIRDTYNITAARVRERIKIRRAYASGHLAVEIAVESKFGRRATNVITFGARQLKRGGVSVKIRRDRPPTRGKDWFVLTNRKTGGTFVAKRVGPKRGDIESVMTIDAGQMFNAKRVNAALLGHIRQRFPAEFRRQADFYVAKFNS